VTYQLPSDLEIERERLRVLEEQKAAGLITAWGRGTYGAPQVIHYEGDAGHLSVGSYCSIALDVRIFLGGGHRTDWVSTYPFRAVHGLPGAYEDGHPVSRGDVQVGNDVWLARGCTILSGVTIGDGAAVAAGAMVTSDVRPYAIVAGNPAREVRRRFDDAAVDRLLVIRWWEWPHEEILASVDLLNGGTVADLDRYAATRQGARAATPPFSSRDRKTPQRWWARRSATARKARADISEQE
jgi:acetyltransferase-like isoleucine patch superfamily enzyme